MEGAGQSIDVEAFIETLTKHSTPTNFPISKAIYTPDQITSYTKVLTQNIRNPRFTTPSTRKPFVIIAALHASHVQATVNAARTHRVQMKIRSGGHDYEGSSYVCRDTPFFILDMSNLSAIEVDVENESAWVESGATLGELYYTIAKESSVHAFPGGTCPSVCVGGLFLGGGYGPMMRKYGLSVDNIIDAKLVDSEGRILNRNSMGEDLFWAIRGGGASFGVVLAYKIKLVHVPEFVTVFRVQRTLEENATSMVNQWQHVAHKLDDNLFIRLILDVVKNKTGNKTIRATFVSLFLGSSSKLVAIVNDKFHELGLRNCDCIEMKWIESVLFWWKYPIGTPAEVLLDRQVCGEDLVFVKRKSDFVQEPIPKHCFEGIWKKMIEFEVPSMYFNPYGGRMNELRASETPFPHREGNLWKIQYKINWREEGSEAEEKHLELARQIYEYMTPFVSKDPRCAFLNYKDHDLGTIKSHEDSSTKTNYSAGTTYGFKYFKDNFTRLVRIKTKCDPSNVFRHEQSIPTLPDQKLE